MIKEGRISPEDGVRLIDAIEKADSDEQPPAKGKREGRSLRWLNVEICTKRGEKTKSITPIRIPYSLVKLFFRFIPKDATLAGDSTLEETLSSLEDGKPLELLDDKDGRSIRITTE